MAAVAAEAVRLSGIDAEPSEILLSPEAEATALFGAAIHSAHRLLATVRPKQEVLKDWCREALAVCPEIEQAMRDLLEARSATVPAVLTAAQQRNLASPFRLLLQHGWRWDWLDADLLEAMEMLPLPTAPKDAELELWGLRRRREL